MNSRVAVDSQGEGIGGDIFVTSDFLNLFNSAIATETFSSDGGNISLDIGDRLFLERGSNVTATAGLAQRAGNGGNVTVFSPSIVASIDEDNNIFADAFTGLGGRIFVSANELINIGFQSENIPVRNDITASSGVQSSRLILTPELAPFLREISLSGSGIPNSFLSLLNSSSGSVVIESEVEEDNDLPEPLVDAEDFIGKDACAVNNDKIAGGSSFEFQGKGGLPANPIDGIGFQHARLDYLTHSVHPQFISEQTSVQSTNIIPSEELQFAQSWQRLPDGRLQLIAFSDQGRSDFVEHPYCVAQEI